MNKIHKKILSGIILGGILNILGVILYMFIMTNEELVEGLTMAYRGGFLGKIIGLGALPNLILFSYFIKQKHIYQSRGVVFITIIAALFTLFLR